MHLALLTKTKRRHLHKCCLYSSPSLKHHNYLYEIKVSIIFILEASDGKWLLVQFFVNHHMDQYQ